jgi:hypothetical protein
VFEVAVERVALLVEVEVRVVIVQLLVWQLVLLHLLI